MAMRVPQVSAWQNLPVDPRKKKGTVMVPITSLAFYRRYTELLLRRYMQVSLRMGQVPSVLGNCMFRGKVSSYRVRSFEDAVIFVYDVDRCLRQLSPEEKELVARIALQEYTQAEAADLTKQSLRTVVRKYGEAIDRLTAIFLEKELLEVGPLYDGQ
ncbi:sigma-70 family RNA polymerase sigma factor [Acidipila sp. EB88]|nr:sigma-70 family RNA polymerase sigma factor [Acidipila sp. EB88]